MFISLLSGLYFIALSIRLESASLIQKESPFTVRIFDTLGIISSGFLNANQAMELLMIGPEYTQVAIKSEKAAERLKWIGADQAELPDTESLDMERKKYQEQFGAVLERLVEE